MSEMVMTEPIKEVQMNTALPKTTTNDGFSGKWSDMEKDMAIIAAEVVPPVQPPGPEKENLQATVTEKQTATITPQVIPEITKTVKEQVAPTTKVEPEVPEKFKGPDGKLDQERLLKSYGEAEKSLKRLQNASKQLPNAEPTTTPTAQAQPGPLTPFELQVAQDIFSGGGFTEQQAVSMARVQVRLAEARHQADTAATFSKVQHFEQTLEEQARRSELESLAKTNPWVLTPQGQNDLVKVREENPWLNNSPEPWKAATMFLLGQKSLYGNGQTAQVSMPNPTGIQQSAMPLPVIPAQKAMNSITLNTQKEIEDHLKTLTPAQEREFWMKQGFKWDSAPTFKGPGSFK